MNKMDAGLFIYFPRDTGQDIYFKMFDGQDIYFKMFDGQDIYFKKLPAPPPINYSSHNKKGTSFNHSPIVPSAILNT